MLAQFGPERKMLGFAAKHPAENREENNIRMILHYHLHLFLYNPPCILVSIFMRVLSLLNCNTSGAALAPWTNWKAVLHQNL